MTKQQQWCELPASLLSHDGRLLLAEPPDANVAELARRLRSGDYGKPFVVDDGATRRLHFDFRYVQSEMDLRDPDALTFAYTRKMMAFLLFVPRPKHVVIVGLGGGSLTKFCYRQLPAARVTTIEIDRDIIGFGRLFEVPEPDERLRIVHADAGTYFSPDAETADVVLQDGCDPDGVASVFATEAFYRRLRDTLRPKGMLVANLIGRARHTEALQRVVEDAFDGQTIAMKVPSVGNRLVFGFNDLRTASDWEQLGTRARTLQQRHGLDFPAFLRRLRHGQRGEALR